MTIKWLHLISRFGAEADIRSMQHSAKIDCSLSEIVLGKEGEHLCVQLCRGRQPCLARLSLTFHFHQPSIDDFNSFHVMPSRPAVCSTVLS